MKNSKRFVHGMMALTIIMSIPPQSFARIQAIAGTTIIPQAPGTYEYKQYDETKLQVEVLAVLEKRSQEDKAFVESAVHQLNQAVLDLVNEQMKSGLTQLSDESLAGGKPADVLTFLAAKRSFEVSIEKINTQINSVSQLPSVMKSNPGLTVGGRIQEIQNRYNVDLSPVIHTFEEQVQAIATKLNSLNFNVRAKNGALVPQQGLTPDSKLIENQYTADELNAMRTNAARMRVIHTDEQNMVNQFNLFALKNLNTAIDSYGQAYRKNMDDGGKTDALKMVEQIFFARSLLRAQYGVALGALQLNYDLQSFNWDFLSSDNHLPFSGNMLTRSNELLDLHNKIATALSTQEARAKEVFGDNKNLISRVSSAVTFLKGERSHAGLNVIMLKLLLADLEEEFKVGQPGGRRELKSILRTRYYNTKENEAYFKDLGRSLTGASKDAWADSNGINADTLVGIMNLVKVPLSNYQARLNQAQTIDDSLAEIEKSINGKIDQINNDLLN